MDRDTKGEKSRKIIIKKARQLFSRHGYDGVSFKMIADSCKISQAAPRYHFKTKFNLFKAVIDEINKNRNEQVKLIENIKDTAYEQLLKFVIGQVSWTHIYTPEAEIYLLFLHFAAIKKEFAQLYSEVIQKDLTKIEGLLLAGQREGVFHFDGSSEDIAKIILNYINGEWIQILSGRQMESSRESINDRIKILIHKVGGVKESES